MDFTQRHPYYKGSGGRQWWRNGGPTVEVEPKHRGGKKIKIVRLGCLALLGPTFVFRENIFKNIFYGLSGVIWQTGPRFWTGCRPPAHL